MVVKAAHVLQQVVTVTWNVNWIDPFWIAPMNGRKLILVGSMLLVFGKLLSDILL